MTYERQVSNRPFAMPIVVLFALASAFVATSTSHAAIQINEIFINPPGTDNGQEYIEFRSTTGGIESLAGLTLLGIEGDGTNPGVIDFFLSLSSFSTGSNGLFLWRDAASIISPAPAAATTINVADFNPDIENGSQTFLLVSGFSGALAQSLDTNIDGVLDVTPWTSVIDGIGLIENDGAANLAYAAGLGFTNIGPNAGFNADALSRDGATGEWLAFDVLGTNPGGPYTVDPTVGRSSFTASGAETLSPGNINFSAVPEPSSLALIGVLGLAGFAYRRRSRR